MHVVLLFLPVLAFASDFSYSRTSEWKGKCKEGVRQSPINLQLGYAKIASLDPLKFKNYDKPGRITVGNNGHTEIGDGFSSWPAAPSLSGGGLSEEYTLQQFHFHWGESDATGSEHKFDGIRFPLEAHLVHYRSSWSKEKVESTPGGIAVLAVVFVVETAVKGTENTYPLHILDHIIANTTKSGNSMTVSGFRPETLVPMSTNTFFRFRGSLTIPPCSEDVAWIVLTTPLKVTPQQLATLRKHQGSHGPMGHNNRETQEVNRRNVVLSSDKIEMTATIGEAKYFDPREEPKRSPQTLTIEDVRAMAARTYTGRKQTSESKGR